MGVCFSKSGKASLSNKVPSKVPPKENGMLNEEKKQPKLAEKIPDLTVNKDSCNETYVKNTAQHEDGSSKASGTVAGPLRVSSCTKEEVDAILIQCGRLSRNSSGKASNELAGSSGRKRRSGSKGSRDFDDERKEEGNELDKSESRPSPSRRGSSRELSGSRERGSSGGRRVSRSPGRRLDGPASSATTCDKLKQQPAKMVSVPATEKCTLFGNDRAEVASLGAERLSTAHQLSRSSSPVNKTGISNENVHSSTKTGKFPYRRDPMAEIDENSLRNQNEISTSMFNRTREVDEGAGKPTQTQIIQQAKKPELVEEAMDAKVNDEVESLSQRTQSRIRSRPSRKTSHDLDNNPELTPISDTTLKFEEIQNKKQQQYQDAKANDEVESLSLRTLSRIRSRPSRKTSHDLDNNPELTPISDITLRFEEIQNKNQQKYQDAFLFPICVSETSTLQTVTELNSSFMEQRSYGTKIVTEPELEVKGSSTVRDVEPRESTGSNSSMRQPWASPSDLNCVDSSDRCYTQLSVNGKEVDVEDEVIPLGTQQQKKSWPETVRGQRSRASSSGESLTEATIKAAKTSGKKLNHSPLQQVR